MFNSRSRQTRTRAFSALEMLATVGGLGIVATVAIVTITPLLADVRKVRLENQVAALNDAVKAYLSQGGDLSAASTPAQVLAKLKTTASNTEYIAGYGGSFVDPRLDVKMQTTAEAAAPEWRALWDGTDNLFVMQDTGDVGVKEFILNEALANAVSSEHRNQAMDLAHEDDWIWDFTDLATPTISISPAVDANDVTPAPAPVDPDALTQLLPVTFSPKGDLFEYYSFPSSVTLASPNDPGTTTIMYAINGGAWQEYTGPVPVGRGETLSAFVKMIVPDPGVYNSFISTEIYRSENPSLTGSSSGAFKSPVGTGALVSNIAPGGSDSEFLYGAAIAGGPQNRLEFAGSSFSNINPDQAFTIGQITYLNSTTGLGTSAYEVILQLDMSFSSPSGTTESVDIVLGLESTKNYSWLTADQKADYVRFGQMHTDFSAVFSGETYYLNLEFVYSGSDGYSTVDEFHVHEGATATATIQGTFSTTPMDPPDATGTGGTGGPPAPPSIP